MFTVCPKCALTLVVTAADLRIAQGYVRCGRCSSVFNALARLSERQGAEGTEAAPAAAAPADVAAPAAPAPGPAAAPRPQEPAAPLAGVEPAPTQEPALPDSALEFNPETTDVNSVFITPPPNPQWTAATGSFRALVAANQEPAPAATEPSVDIEIDAAFLASMLSDQEAQPPVAEEAAPTVAPSAAAGAPVRVAIPAEAARRARILADATAAAEAVASGRASTLAAERERAALTEEQAIEEAEALAADEDPTEEAAIAVASPLSRLRPYAWPAGTVIAAVLLIAQVVNHYRDELAGSARLNPLLTAVYTSLGIRLYPHWDLHAYDVRQLGASGDAAGAGVITVRASIKNGAAQPQPLPLLRVTLQDRFGNRIAARDVAPKAYLPSAMPASSFLAAGQRIDAQMGFADPGPNAVGFEVDACLPSGGGVIACANDGALR